METYEPQTFPTFEAGSQFCPQVSHASRVPLPGSGEAQAMTVGSGAQCSMLLDQSSPLGAFSRILLASSHWTSSQEFCYVWNRLDTRFGLSAFQLTPLGQSTADSECSLWRTPNAQIVSGGGMDGEKRLGAGHAMQLSDQALTPKLWPTPQSHDAAKGDLERVGRFGTEHGGRNLNDTIGGSLNPRFVCELMGYEADHTNLKHWATLLSRSRPIRSSKRSPSSASRILSEFAWMREDCVPE
jgi:hypothetical protein